MIRGDILSRWRGDLDDAVMEFITHPGLGPLDAEAFMADWYAGKMFPCGFASLRGCLCKIAQDRGYTHEQTDELLAQVFENSSDRTMGKK